MLGDVLLHARTTLGNAPPLVLFALLLFGACGPKAAPATAETTPAPTEEDTGSKDCKDYENQTELCRPSCEDCAGPTPGNACNECADACATHVFCDECGQSDYCED